MIGAEKSFAILFKKYRLRSEIETLSEFGDLLAQEGIAYETSLFTKWQNGERVPKDRRVLLSIVELFAKLGGIQTIDEANSIFASVNQRDLSLDEIKGLHKFFYIPKTDSRKDKLKIFLYASPLFDTFDHLIDIIYTKIEELDYTHLNDETQSHRLRTLMKKIDNGEDEELMEYKIIIQDFVEKIKNADICVFETSAKSLGTGYFIHHALTLSKPTVILYYRDNKLHLFSAVIDKNLILKSYNEINLNKVLQRVLNAAREKIH